MAPKSKQLKKEYTVTDHHNLDPIEKSPVIPRPNVSFSYDPTHEDLTEAQKEEKKNSLKKMQHELKEIMSERKKHSKKQQNEMKLQLKQVDEFIDFKSAVRIMRAFRSATYEDLKIRPRKMSIIQPMQPKKQKTIRNTVSDVSGMRKKLQGKDGAAADSSFFYKSEQGFHKNKK